MKKIALFLVLMTTLLSCSVDEPDRYTNYILPIESYTLPATFTVGATHEVKLKYQKPTACYNYKGIYYYSENNNRTIAIYADVKNGETCSEALPPLTEVSFSFKPETAGTYVFKFYKGPDEAGKDKFEEVNVVVTAAP
jgi:hypothetical protein